MKSFILGIGRFLINIVTLIWLTGILIIPWPVSTWAENTFAWRTFNGIGVLTGFLIFIIMLIVFVMSNFVIYLLLDICDNLSSTAKSLKIIESRTIRQQQTVDFISDDLLKCSKCGTSYNVGDKFCEECGTELN